jgi:hypothetical protein
MKIYITSSVLHLYRIRLYIKPRTSAVESIAFQTFILESQTVQSRNGIITSCGNRKESFASYYQGSEDKGLLFRKSDVLVLRLQLKPAFKHFRQTAPLNRLKNTRVLSLVSNFLYISRYQMAEPEQSVSTGNVATPSGPEALQPSPLGTKE